MIPIHVALVPYYEDEYVNESTVLRVAAALQMQLTRDFTPIWGIPAVVSPFMSLNDVPPASIPLLIVKPELLEPRGHGFHLSTKGQPIGLVAGGPGWSLAASHELLETVCDPQGKTKVMAESIADKYPKALTAAAKAHPHPQGQVAYLLEICDPCQKFHYTLNGFQVSDFVTPRYYAPGATTHGEYSFTGSVTGPREVPSNGYVTWYTSIPEAPIWQAINDANGLRIGPLAVSALAYSRHHVDHYSDFVSALEPPQQNVEAAAAEAQARESARRYGAELTRELEQILKEYGAADNSTAILLTDLLPILRELAYEEDKWNGYSGDHNSLFRKVRRVIPDRFEFKDGIFPSREQYQAVYTSLKHISDRHSGLRISKLVAITAIQGTTLG